MTVLPAVGRLLIFVSLGFWLSACSPLTESELDEQKNPHFLEGKNRSNALNHKGAVEAFEKALEANPRSASAHLELGLLYEQKMNDYASAIYHLEKHLKLRPTSHLAESVRQRIMSCKLELARTVSFSLVNQKVQAALDRLTTENTALRQQVDHLKAELSKAQLAQQAHVITDKPISVPNPPVLTPIGPLAEQAPIRTQQPSMMRTTVERPRVTGLPRTHVVQRGETLASIARRYGIPLSVLQAANPRIEPRRLLPGKTISIPAPKH